MGGEVVEENNRSRPEGGHEHFTHAGEKHAPVARAFQIHACSDPLQRPAAQDRHVGPVVLRSAGVGALALPGPGVSAAHGTVGPALIHKDQILRRQRGEQGRVLFAQLLDPFGVTLRGVQILLFFGSAPGNPRRAREKSS